MWPGLVGKGGPGAEPPIDLDTMLDHDREGRGQRRRSSTASICSSSIRTSASIRRTTTSSSWPTSIGRRDLVVGSLVAPVWPPTGGGSAMGSDEERKAFVTQVRKACAIAQEAERDLGIRKYGVIRIDSAASPADWAKDPAGNTKKIAETFRQAADVAEAYGERLAAEGEICWGGMHSVKRMVELLEAGRTGPKTVGFQADMAHTLLFTLGYNAPEDRILPENFDWSDQQDARRRAAQDDRRAAALDDRLPRRPERRHRPRLRLARQDRPPLPAARSQRQARHRQARRLLAARRERQRHAQVPAHLLGRLHVPQRGHDASRRPGTTSSA